MAGLVPAIHVFLPWGAKDVDARHKAGHDEELAKKPRNGISGPSLIRRPTLTPR
jgi:hypothetical protein